MSNKIILKKSSVADKVPSTGDLEYGELAINYADKRLYFKDSNNNISYFGTGGGGGGSGTVISVDASGGNTGLSFSGGPITSSGTLTLSGTLGANSGGTGQSTYTQGDLLYASAANTLGKLGIGANNQVLTVSNGTLAWANSSSGGSSSGASGQIQLSGGSGTFTSNSEFSYSTTNRTLTLGDGGSPISNNNYWTGQTYTISGSIADAGYNGDKIVVSGGNGGIQAQGYYSSVFPGNGVLTTNNNSNLAPGTGDFTVELFVRFTTLPSDTTGLFQNDAVGSSSNDKFWVGVNNPGGGQYEIYFARHSTNNYSLATVSLVANQWYHIAVVRSSGTSLIFLNGVAQSVTNSTALNGVNFGQNGAAIGAISTPSYLNGYISNVRYTVGEAVYTSNFSVPSTPLSPLPNTQLLTCQNNTFVDNSNNNLTITNSGTVTTTTLVNPFNTGPEFGHGGPLVLSGGTSYASSKSGNVIIQTDGVDRVIIDNYGNFIQNANTALAKNTIVGVTSQRTLLAKADAGIANNVPITAWNNATANDNVLIEFGTEDTYTTRGNIAYNRDAGQVSYNTTSDYRLKVVVGPVTNSGQVIDNLKVYTGMMLDANIIRPMMIAHEAQEYVPYAVSGQKDAVDENGNPMLQQMDHSILVPLLIAEIQSLRARVNQLENGKK